VPAPPFSHAVLALSHAAVASPSACVAALPRLACSLPRCRRRSHTALARAAGRPYSTAGSNIPASPDQPNERDPRLPESDASGLGLQLVVADGAGGMAWRMLRRKVRWELIAEGLVFARA